MYVFVIRVLCKEKSLPSVQEGCTVDGGLSPLLPEGLKHAWKFRVTGCNSTGRSVSPHPQGPRGENLLALGLDPTQG